MPKDNPLICDVVYVGFEVVKSWAVVIGKEFDAFGEVTPYGFNCYFMPTKPTKRQIRKLKKLY